MPVAFDGERRADSVPVPTLGSIAEGFDEPTVLRVIKLIDRSEYKRRQAAPGLKVTSRAFGFGRRMPIAQNYVPGVVTHGEISAAVK